MKFFLIIMIFFGFSEGIAIAQTPGNVSGSKIWLKAKSSNNPALQKKINQQDLTASYFNFNPILDRHSFAKAFKNIVAEQYSAFVVFKSDFEDEHIIMTVNRGKTNVIITNKELLSNTETPFKINSDKGIILSYLNGNNDKNGKKRNSLVIDDLFAEDEEGKEQLIEFIYFPRLLTKLERQKVETYLSIKYGISISDDFDYLNSSGDKIWDIKENSIYKNRITGIGRDNAYCLYQKQSGNSEKDGIYVGLGKVDTTNAHNKYLLKDKSFLLWGDNGAKTLFTLDKDNGLKKMARMWKINASGIKPTDSITTQLKINKKEFGYAAKGHDEYLWLCINPIGNETFDYINSKFIKQSSEDDNFIYFNNVAWDNDGNGFDTFTFTQGPDFILEHSEDFTCESNNGVVKAKLIGGIPPYTLNFNGHEIISQKDIAEFANLESGIFDLKVTDSKGNTVSDKIEINALAEAVITLAPLWHLNSQQEVIIKPTINTAEQSDLSFEWIKDEKRISSETEFTAKTPGDYILVVSNAEGCKKNIPFRVEGNTTPSDWKVYPNPVLSGEQFSIEFTLEKESQAVITISSLEGKQILQKDLGSIKNFIFKETLIISGVYLIKVQIGNTSETVKLIVH